MKPNKERIKKLVQALKSGKYKQTDGCLRYGDEFCCLGVACDIYAKETKEYDWKIIDSDYFFVNEANILPKIVQEWYGFEHEDPYITSGNTTIAEDPYITAAKTAAGLNDSHVDFTTIAELFEEKYLS